MNNKKVLALIRSDAAEEGLELIGLRYLPDTVTIILDGEPVTFEKRRVITDIRPTRGIYFEVGLGGDIRHGNC